MSGGNRKRKGGKPSGGKPLFDVRIDGAGRVVVTPHIKPAARLDEPHQRAAARAVAPHVQRQAKTVLGALITYGPQTRDELAGSTGIKPTTLCAWLKALVDAGFIEVHGEKPSAAGVLVNIYRERQRRPRRRHETGRVRGRGPFPRLVGPRRQ